MSKFGLLRLGNCGMAFIGVIIGAISELLPLEERWWLPQLIEYPWALPLAFNVLLAAMAAFLVTGAGNALNDFYDRKLDRKAHPGRPIPSGKVTPAQAWNFAIGLFLAGLVLAILVNMWCFIIAILNTGLLFAYEGGLKAKGLVGNLTISYLTASVFLFGGAAVFGMLVTPILFLLALLANVGREVTKDIEDMEGDRGYRKTLPITKGKASAQRVAVGSTVLAVLLSPLPFFMFFNPDPSGMLSIVLRSMGLLYLMVVILADAVFIHACYLVFKDQSAAQNHMKWGMVVAMMAFITPSLFIWMFMILYPSVF